MPSRPFYWLTKEYNESGVCKTKQAAMDFVMQGFGDGEDL